jgi:hypothetical protein
MKVAPPNSVPTAPAKSSGKLLKFGEIFFDAISEKKHLSGDLCSGSVTEDNHLNRWKTQTTADSYALLKVKNKRWHECI